MFLTISTNFSRCSAQNPAGLSGPSKNFSIYQHQTSLSTWKSFNRENASLCRNMHRGDVSDNDAKLVFYTCAPPHTALTTLPPSRHWTGGRYTFVNARPTELPPCIPIETVIAAFHHVATLRRSESEALKRNITAGLIDTLTQFLSSFHTCFFRGD